MSDERRTAEFGVPGALRDRLVAAVLDGTKTATTSLLAEWEADGEALPEPGERQTIVDSDGRPVGVLEVVTTEVVRLGDADDRLAHEEGEGFAGVADWRRAHLEFWEAVVRTELPDAFPLDDDTLVVVERIRLVERL